MKARKVKGLDPDGPLAENAFRLIDVRLAELQELAPPALESGDSLALHDMRIAAKRLRYVLELTAPAFGSQAAAAAKTVKALQSLLGDLHDCDELVPRVRAQIETLQDRRAAALAEAAGGDVTALPTDPPDSLEERGNLRGLDALATYALARRRVLLDRCRARWNELEPVGFGAQLRAGLNPGETAR